MEKRKSGFYWVKERGDSGWSVAYYSDNGSHNGWIIPGVCKAISDSYFDEINENRIMSPDEWE